MFVKLLQQAGPRMRRSKDDAEQTRCSILDAAERIFCDQGVAAATLEKISRSAGVTRGAFYWHFKDKRDLLVAMRDRCALPQEALIRSAADQGHDDPLGLLEEAGVEVLRRFETEESQQRLFRIMSGPLPGEDLADWMEQENCEMFLLLGRLAAMAGENGTLRRDFTADEAAITLMVMMNGLLSEWLRSGKAFPLSGFGRKLLHEQMRMLRAGPDDRPA